MQSEKPTNIAGRRETPPYCTNGCGRYVTMAGQECRECAPLRHKKPTNACPTCGKKMVQGARGLMCPDDLAPAVEPEQPTNPWPKGCPEHEAREKSNAERRETTCPADVCERQHRIETERCRDVACKTTDDAALAAGHMAAQGCDVDECPACQRELGKTTNNAGECPCHGSPEGPCGPCVEYQRGEHAERARIERIIEARIEAGRGIAECFPEAQTLTMILAAIRGGDNA